MALFVIMNYRKQRAKPKNTLHCLLSRTRVSKEQQQKTRGIVCYHGLQKAKAKQKTHGIVCYHELE